MVKKITPELAEFVYNGGFLECKDIHDHSCIWNTVLKFKDIFNLAYQFYTPLHLLPVLLFKRKEIVQK